MLGQGPTYGINGNVVSPKKKFRINFSKGKQNFASVYITVMIIVTCLLTEKKSLSLKLVKKIVDFSTQLCLGSISNRFGAAEFREASLK